MAQIEYHSSYFLHPVLSSSGRRKIILLDIILASSYIYTCTK